MDLTSMSQEQLIGVVKFLQAQNEIIRAAPDAPPVNFNWVTLDDAIPGSEAVAEAAMLQFPRYVLQEMAVWAAALLGDKKAGQFMEIRFEGVDGVPPMYVTFVRDDGPSMADTIHKLRKELAALKAAHGSG